MSGEQRTVIKGNSSKYVKLNVGGALYYTTIGTLTKQDTMLQAMFSGRMEVLTDSEGWVLIDRNGKHFGAILDFLRDGEVSLNMTRHELQQLLAEAKFYLVQNLVELIVTEIKRLDRVEDMSSIPQVPIITSAKQEQALLSHTKMPVIKFLFNRQNNKYSYTSNSDEHMLKNLEKFDKLSLQFHNRILFIKSVYCSQEICCWYFYANSSKIGEVCCTSIVYGTDKKHTKIDFPEARIYEEVLHCLMYEDHKKGPDAEMMRVIKGIPGTGPGHHSDEEGDERPERQERGTRRK